MGSYVRIEEAQALGLEGDNLQSLLALYSGLVDEYCRTKFLPEKVKLKADAEKRIYFPRTPLLSVQEVLYRGRPLVEDEDYFIYPELRLMQLAEPDNYEQQRRSITIRYTYGFETVPSLVKKVICDLIRLNHNSSSADGNGVVSSDPTIVAENFDGEYSYQKNSSKTVEDMQRDILSMLDVFIQPQYQEQLQETGVVRARLL